jgi:hypothetical protein
MRTPTLLLSALLLGGALAFVPAASADGPACTTDLCPDPNEPPTCKPSERDLGSVRLTVSEDCSVDLVTGEGINCVGPWINKDEYRAGPVHWTSYSCGSPGGDPLCCVSSAASASQQIPPCQCYPAPLCEPINQLIASGDGPVTFTLSDTCHPTVTVDVTKVVDCVYGTHKTVVAGPLSVTYPTCSSPCGGGLDYCPPVEDVGTPQAIPPCTCPPPPPLCYQVVRALAASPYYSIDDYCNVTVTYSLDCGLWGAPEYHHIHEAKLTVDVQTCKYVLPP